MGRVVRDRAAIDVTYTPEPRATGWRCVGTSSANASGTLHLAELGADGSLGRALAYEFEDVGFVGTSGGREMAIAAFGQRVAVMFGSRQASSSGLGLRLLVFDTSKIP